ICVQVLKTSWTPLPCVSPARTRKKESAPSWKSGNPNSKGSKPIADFGLEIAGEPGLVIFSMRNCQAAEVLCVSWRPSRLRGYLHFNPQSEIRNWQSAIVRLRKPGSCGPNARPSYQPLQ